MTPSEMAATFRRNSNGSWTTLRPVRVSGPNGYVQLPANATFGPGVRFMGIDVAAWLNNNSR
jgi:hypothetical protein